MCELLRGLPFAPILDEEACGSDVLQGAEEADLVEELGVTDLEGSQEVVVSVGLDEGVAVECEEGEERRPWNVRRETRDSAMVREVIDRHE